MTMTSCILTISASSSRVSGHNPIFLFLEENYEEIKDDGELEAWVLVRSSRLHLGKNLLPSN